MRPVARFRTFGCKLNQVETESLARSFAEAGFDVVGDGPADVFVVNTCTVTSMAEQKARRELRRFLASSPEALVVVTGCYASVSPEEVAALGPRVVVVPGAAKAAVLDLAHDLAEAREKGLDLRDIAADRAARAYGASQDPFAFNTASFTFHTRASLKIQDGCDNRCAYCRVCIARGESVSIAPAIAVERARAIEAAGSREIVLTGVNLSQYRHGEIRFAELLSLLIAETEAVRFRISSWEPDRVDDAFLRAFAHPRVCAHAHLAAQSGSDTVLARMARAYRADTVRRAVTNLRSAKDDPFIAFDAISGFPGETDAEAAATRDLFADLAPAWIHAFVFSPRPGTKAALMKPAVPERVARDRSAVLRDIAVAGRAAYVARWVGRNVEAIVERSAYPDIVGFDEERVEPGILTAVSDNYLKLVVLSDRKRRPLTIPDDGRVTLRVLRALAVASVADPGQSDAEAEWI